MSLSDRGLPETWKKHKAQSVASDFKQNYLIFYLQVVAVALLTDDDGGSSRVFMEQQRLTRCEFWGQNE